MKKLLLLCTFLSLSSCWSNEPTIIQGKVIEKGTGLPVSNIAVAVFKREGLSKLPSRNRATHTQSDRLGQYHFTFDIKRFKYSYSIQTLENQQYKHSEEHGFNLEETNQIDLCIEPK